MLDEKFKKLLPKTAESENSRNTFLGKKKEKKRTPLKPQSNQQKTKHTYIHKYVTFK